MALPSVLDELNRLFEEMVTRPWGAGQRVVPTEIRQVDDGWCIDIPIEGLHASDVQVGVTGRRLTVHGYRRDQRDHRHRTTWSEIAVHRSIPLPADADAKRIDATVEGSTLTIHIRRRTP